MINVFFDMDGLLAKWNTEATIEDTYRPGYFRFVEPDMAAINVLKQLTVTFMPDKVRFFILSARYDDKENELNRFEQDKLAWLKEVGINLPVCFIPCGVSKLEIFTRYNIKGDINLLFDDYTPNVLDWESGRDCIGVKWLNGINGSGRSAYKGLCVDASRMGETSLFFTIISLISFCVSTLEVA